MNEIIKQDLLEIKNKLNNFQTEIEGKTFLITGGAGFIGSWFCDVLNEFNANIICVDNNTSGSYKNIEHLKKRKNFKLIEKNVCDFDTDKKIDFIVHMASIASPPIYQKFPIETLDANVFGTKNMLELAKKNKIKAFLFTSTSEVYGNTTDKLIPTSETFYGIVNPFGPRSMYNEGKRCAEAYCYSYFKKLKLPIRIARIFNTYGPRLDIKFPSPYGRVIIKFIDQVLNANPITIYGDGKQTRSFCYITDQIVGLFKLLLTQNLDGEIVNIGNDKEITILDLGNKIKELTDSKSSFKFLSLPEDDPLRRRPDLTKVKKLLQWEPKIDIDEGLKRTIDWFKM